MLCFAAYNFVCIQLYNLTLPCISPVYTSPPPVFPPDEVYSYPLPQPGTVRVSWTQAPNLMHGFTLMGYSVQYREVGGDMYQSQQITDILSPGELETFELDELELRTTYELRVAVVTLSGVGKYSDVINVTTYAGTSFSRIHLSRPSGCRQIYSLHILAVVECRPLSLAVLANSCTTCVGQIRQI